MRHLSARLALTALLTRFADDVDHFLTGEAGTPAPLPPAASPTDVPTHELSRTSQ